MSVAFSALYIDMNGVLFPGDQVVKSCYQERCDLHVVAMATSVLNFISL